MSGRAWAALINALSELLNLDMLAGWTFDAVECLDLRASPCADMLLVIQQRPDVIRVNKVYIGKVSILNHGVELIRWS